MSRKRRRSKPQVQEIQLPAIAIRQAKTPDDKRAIFDLLAANAVEEMAEAPMDAGVLASTIEQTADEGAALMAVVNGRLIGWLGIVRRQYSYSQEFYLIDSMFWVMPEFRNGDVFHALLQEARGIADASGMKFKLVINNPSRRRGARTDMERTAAIVGYEPKGAVLSFHPRGH